MRRMFGIALIGFSFLIMGCAVRISDVAVKPTPQYKFCQERGGLKIAIDPFFEEERLKEYFGADLLSQGILPVLIVAENHDPKLGYLLDRKFFSATIKMEEELETKDRTDSSVPVPKEAEGAKKVGTAIGLGAIVAPGVMVISLPLLIYAERVQADTRKINENLSKKAFVDRTIFPGESHSGFLYFQVKDRDYAQTISGILIKAKHIISEEELNFFFQIKK